VAAGKEPYERKDAPPTTLAPVSLDTDTRTIFEEIGSCDGLSVHDISQSTRLDDTVISRALRTLINGSLIHSKGDRSQGLKFYAGPATKGMTVAPEKSSRARKPRAEVLRAHFRTLRIVSTF
jgi:hypothetical protein